MKRRRGARRPVGMGAALLLLISPVGAGAVQVVDERGAPVPGASLRAGASPAEAAVLTAAGPSGELTWPRQTATAGTRVWVIAKGYAPVELEPGLVPARGVVTLVRGATIAGVVTDPVTGPVAGARVEIPAPSSDWRLATLTDEQGRFRLPDSPAGDVDVLASAPGFLSARQQLIVVPGGHADLRLVLHRPGWLSVVLPKSPPQAPAPVKGKLFIRSSPQFPAGAAILETPCPRQSAAPDDRALLPLTVEGVWTGAVRVDRLPVGADLELWTALAGSAPAKTSFTLGAPGMSLEAPSSEGGTLAGRLVDDQGRSVAGVEVLLRGVDPPTASLLEWAGGATALSGRDGTWRADHLPAGRVAIEIRGGQWSSLQRSLATIRAGATIEAPPIVLRRGGSLQGKVVDDSTRGPVAGASVRACPETLGCPWTSRARTAPDGTFELSGLEPGTWTVEISHPQYAVLRQAGLTPGHGDVAFRLERGATLSARVLDGGGAPIRSVKLIVADSRWGDPVFQKRLRPEGGSVTIAGLPSGAHTVTLLAPAHAPRRFPALSLQSGRTLDLGDVVFSARRVVRGRVESGDGQPVWGAVVCCLSFDDEPTDECAPPTSSDGAFELGGLPDGEARLRAIAADFAPRTLRLSAAGERSTDADEPPVIVTMERGATVRGIVVDAQGQPVAGARIAIGPSELQLTQSGFDGQYSIEHAPSGPATITMTLDPDRPATWRESRRARLEDGRVATVDFVAGPVVKGQVRRGGAPVTDATVMAVPAGGVPGAATALTDPQGRYQLATPKGDIVTLHVFGGGCRARFPLRIDPALERNEADLDLPPVDLTGWVLDARDGSPLAGASVEWSAPGAGAETAIYWHSVSAADGGRVRLTDNPTTGAETSTLADGSFVLCAPSVGPVTVRVTAGPDHESTAIHREQPGGGPIVVRLKAKKADVVLRVVRSAGALAPAAGGVTAALETVDGRLNIASTGPEGAIEWDRPGTTFRLWAGSSDAASRTRTGLRPPRPSRHPLSWKSVRGGGSGSPESRDWPQERTARSGAL